MNPFSRRRGGMELRLGEMEAEVLGQVVDELRMLVESTERPDHARRMFPPAYPDDKEEQDEFARLTGDELLAAKLGAIDSVERSIARGRTRKSVFTTTLDDEEMQAWLGVLNDARLALGTRLDVTEEMEEAPLDESDPNSVGLSVYRYLGWLQSHLVDELLDAADR